MTTVSIAIPHYNRIQHLLLSLNSINSQSCSKLEISISDNCSTDDSAKQIKNYIDHKLRPGVTINYTQNLENYGYDYNLRNAIQNSTSDYVFLLGSDDGLGDNQTIDHLINFIEKNDYPEVILTNFREFDQKEPSSRVSQTEIIGTGHEVALKWFRGFSYFSGIVLKKTAFERVNTSEYDRSVYVQIYLASRIVASGGTLATLANSCVVKDLQLEDKKASSALEAISKGYVVNTDAKGGLDQVARVAIDAIQPFSTTPLNEIAFRVFLQVYGSLLPNWLYEYRKVGSWKSAKNLSVGCRPSQLLASHKISLTQNVQLRVLYYFSVFTVLTFPLSVTSALRDVFIQRQTSIRRPDNFL
jgi:glycosyltransferase involved in cell wall biosynthesis